MNPHLPRLHPYPFEKFAQLKSGLQPPVDKSPISLSIGEPQHPAPAFVREVALENLTGLSYYPPTKGSMALRETMAQWTICRFGLQNLDPETQIIPVNGTREALFAFAHCVIDPHEQPLVLMPNPFYQIYEGATLLAGAQAYYLNTLPEDGFLPDYSAVPETVWRRCQLLYLCSPGNPTGAITPLAVLEDLLDKAERYDFVLAADECYSEIYCDEQSPPIGLLQACARLGRPDFPRCVVFHSLSKRSNLPGLRSGFVAGDAAILKDFLRYRTYHGCAMSPTAQAISEAAWRDEQHVRDNRSLYRAKFAAVLNILEPVLEVSMPQASFYLWPRTPLDDAEFARRLFAEQNVQVLPGSYLSRPADGINPGQNRVRMALVPPLPDCIEAAERIRCFVDSL
ncbi:MAG: succinyldiaminopimelate transaminase [Gammaproteobacteria bacterium]|nr:succinyldiaminopimelate transaminase [Gammaproteobacteria bacterium]